MAEAQPMWMDVVMLLVCALGVVFVAVLVIVGVVLSKGRKEPATLQDELDESRRDAPRARRLAFAGPHVWRLCLDDCQRTAPGTRSLQPSAFQSCQCRSTPRLVRSMEQASSFDRCAISAREAA